MSLKLEISLPGQKATHLCPPDPAASM